MQHAENIYQNFNNLVQHNKIKMYLMQYFLQWYEVLLLLSTEYFGFKQFNERNKQTHNGRKILIPI